MKKFAFAAICTVAAVGFVMADEFQAQITKVDGNTITYYKGKGGGGGGKGGKKGGGFTKEGDAVKGTAADSIKVVGGKFDADTKKMMPGDPIEGGLKADMFKNASDDAPVTVTLTIADDGKDKGKIVQIMKGGKGGGKKKGGD